MSKLSKNLERASRTVAQWPLSHQRAARTWTRDQLLLSAQDLQREVDKRKATARRMEFGKQYTNAEVMEMMK